MKTPSPRHARRSESEPYIEGATFHSSGKDENEVPRTYHVWRVDIGGGWSYVVSMEVIAKEAAEDILGRAARANETTRDIWDEVWKTSK